MLRRRGHAAASVQALTVAEASPHHSVAADIADVADAAGTESEGQREPRPRPSRLAASPATPPGVDGAGATPRACAAPSAAAAAAAAAAARACARNHFSSPLPAAYRGRLSPFDEARVRQLLPAKLDHLLVCLRSAESSPECLQPWVATGLRDHQAVLRPLAERLGMPVQEGVPEGGDGTPHRPPPGVTEDASWIAYVYVFCGS